MSTTTNYLFDEDAKDFEDVVDARKDFSLILEAEEDDLANRFLWVTIS